MLISLIRKLGLMCPNFPITHPTRKPTVLSKYELLPQYYYQDGKRGSILPNQGVRAEYLWDTTWMLCMNKTPTPKGWPRGYKVLQAKGETWNQNINYQMPHQTPHTYKDLWGSARVREDPGSGGVMKIPYFHKKQGSRTEPQLSAYQGPKGKPRGWCQTTSSYCNCHLPSLPKAKAPVRCHRHRPDRYQTPYHPNSFPKTSNWVKTCT